MQVRKSKKFIHDMGICCKNIVIQTLLFFLFDDLL